jgi:hypothetical protein
MGAIVKHNDRFRTLVVVNIRSSLLALTYLISIVFAELAFMGP